MASIQTGIELQDRFSGVIMGIISSVNLAISSMESMNQSVEAGIDTASLEGAKQQINEATIAAIQLSETFENMASPDVSSVPKPEPISQPVKWQSDGFEVFSSSGMERFTQEAQSANMMLDKLSAKQNEISRKAADANILPPAAINDMTRMAVRIDALKNKVHQLEANPLDLGAGTLNAELEQTRDKLNQAVQEQEALSQAIQEMDVSAANAAYTRLSGIIGSTEQYIRDNASAQENFNAKIEQGTPKAKSFVKALMGFSLVRGTINMVKGQLDSAIGRMDTMANYNRTVTAITENSEIASASLDKLKEVTNGTAYGLDVAASSTQNFVTRGMDIGNAVNEVSSWADAVSFYGDGTNETLSSVTDALGKMLTKGTVEMDQLNRLTDAGINAVGMYAQATGQSAADVQANLSKGKISSQDFITTVSSAFENGTNGVLNISGAAKEAGSTWATSLANAKAAVTRGVIDIIDGINQGLSDAGFGTILDGVKEFGVQAENVLSGVGSFAGQVVSMAAPLINTVVSTFSYIADNANITLDSVTNGAINFAGVCISILEPIFTLVSSIAVFAVDHWGAIAPIIGVIVAALASYKVALIVHNGIQAISTGLKTVATVASYAHAAATRKAVSATTKETAAQLGLNTAFLACPITWIIIGLTVLIAVIIAVASYFSGAGHVAQSVFGAICGGINVVIQFFKNSLIQAVNLGYATGKAIGALAENVQTAFHNAIRNVQSFWFDMLSTALTVVESICKALNKLPFISFDYSGVSQLADSYAAKAEAAANDKRDYTSIGDAFNNGLDRFDAFKKGWAKDAYESGAKWGDGISDKIKNMLSINDKKNDDKTDENNYASILAQSNDEEIRTAANTGETAGNTAKAADALSTTSEDLEYIRDMAETDYINRFTTASITVNQTNNNTINNDMDLDGVTEHLRTTIEDEMNVVAEGVH